MIDCWVVGILHLVGCLLLLLLMGGGVGVDECVLVLVNVCWNVCWVSRSINQSVNRSGVRERVIQLYAPSLVVCAGLLGFCCVVCSVPSLVVVVLLDL